MGEDAILAVARNLTTVTGVATLATGEVRLTNTSSPGEGFSIAIGTDVYIPGGREARPLTYDSTGNYEAAGAGQNTGGGLTAQAPNSTGAEATRPGFASATAAVSVANGVSSATPAAAAAASAAVAAVPAEAVAAAAGG